ncbi:MAG: tetratricopeptide repeat protein, partial [Cyanobacteria bacterium J06607_13]
GLDLYRKMDDQIGQRILLSLLADTYAEAEAYPQSIDAQTQVLAIARRTRNTQLEAESLSELGYAHFMEAQHGEAVDYYQSALTLFRQLGDRPQEVAVLNNLGRAASLNQDFDTALTAYQQALDIFTELNRPVQVAHLWVNIGQAHSAAGDMDAAIEAFQQSVKLTEVIREQQADSTLPPRLEAAYRELAVLLQQKNRGSEAQQVLGLI